MYNYFFSKGGNSKTGLPTTTTSKNSCPISCELKGNGCYAEIGHTAIHWNKLSNAESNEKNSLNALVSNIKSHFKYLTDKRIRLNQAGDLPHNNEIIDAKSVLILASELKKAKIKAYTYTHHNLNLGDNLKTIFAMIKNGIVVNYSAKNERHAIELLNDKKTKKLPICTIISPQNHNKKNYFVEGVQFIRCPSEYLLKDNGEKIQCKDCNLCMRPQRDFVVGFTAHGVRKNKVNTRLDAEVKSNLINAVNI